METAKRYELSDLDRFAPSRMIEVFLFYEDRQSTTNLDELIASLRAGIKNGIEQYPFIAGTVHFDDVGKPYILTSPEKRQVELKIRSFAGDEYKHFSALAETSFRLDDIDPVKLVPEWPADEPPVCILQLNIIEGGFILTWVMHHSVADGTSADALLSTICQGSKAYLHNMDMPKRTPDLNRDPFNGQDLPVGVSKRDLLGLCQLYDLTDSTGLSNNPSAVEPGLHFEAVIYQICESELQQIKQQCTRLLDGVKYVSSYDCIAAMIWTSITRARVLCHPEKHSAKSLFIHVINLRSRDPENVTSQDYFGNAVMPWKAGPVDIQSLIMDGAISTAASLIRQSTNEVNLASACVKHLKSLTRALAPTEKLESRVGFNDTDVFVNSWYSMNTGNYDFGIGSPKALRPLRILTRAYSMILPSFSESSTRVYEIFVQLPREESALLRKDAEFLKYFTLLTEP